MKRDKAALYCDLSVSAFEREVLEGRLPQPFKLGNRDHWCKNAIDRALDHITGEGQDNEPDYRRKHRERHGQEAA